MNLKDRFRDVETDCRNRLHDLAPPNRGGLNSTHIHGAHAPVEEPSTASDSDVERRSRLALSARSMIATASAACTSLRRVRQLYNAPIALGPQLAGILSILAGLGFFLAAAAWLVWKGHMFSGVLLALGALGWFAPIILPAAGNRLRHVELPAFNETATIVGPAGRTFALTQHLSR